MYRIKLYVYIQRKLYFFYLVLFFLSNYIMRYFQFKISISIYILVVYVWYVLNYLIMFIVNKCFMDYEYRFGFINGDQLCIDREWFCEGF